LSRIALNGVRLDGGTQPRVETDWSVVEEYKRDLEAGAKFPPVVVYHDGHDLWLESGFHRYHAHMAAGYSDIEAEVRQGTLRTAILVSCGENAEHGWRRTNEDKRRVVRRLLEDNDWRNESNEWIGQRCKVTARMVGMMREELYPPTQNVSDIRTVHRSGGSFQMNVANIGRQPQVPAGHRENEERPRFLAVAEALHAISAAQSTLPDPLAAASEHAGFDIDEAGRISIWWAKFAAHLRQRIDRAS
jgi:hypothetical protein